jgi:hypothetical protein
MSDAVSQLFPPHAPTIVTGFIDIGSQVRSAAEYVALGEQLLQLGLPTVLYLDESLTVDAPPQTIVIPTRFSDCWLAGRVPKGIRLPARANAAKDTLDYLILVHQKSRWIADAFGHTEADLVVWIDFGCMHVPCVGPQEVAAFYSRLPYARRDVITVASMWGPPIMPVSLDSPAWHAVGGVLIVPRQLADRFALLVEQAAARLIEGGRLAWEVNTWAIVWRDHPELFAGYPCVFNASLFEGFQPGRLRAFSFLALARRALGILLRRLSRFVNPAAWIRCGE